MAALTTSHNNSPSPSANYVNDDLFNYDPGNIDEIFREVDTNINIPKKSTETKNEADSGAALGIDEEVKVTRKRKPTAKLDDARLLSQAGIPKLRRTAKEKLRFKGKGHEYSDAARLLNFYQLWLDDLYPRAKFSDGLAMIEKLGHSKRIQVMRREWIDEGKPKFEHVVPVVEENEERRDEETGEIGVDREADEYMHVDRNEAEGSSDVLTRARGVSTSPPVMMERKSLFGDGLFVTNDDEEEAAPEEDELDALLAEQAMEPRSTDSERPHGSLDVRKDKEKSVEEGNFDDDMEAMASFGEIW